MTETEVERLVVRLTGEGSSFQKMMETAAKSSEKVAAQVEVAAKKIESLHENLNRFGERALRTLEVFGAGEWIKGGFEAFEKMEVGQIRLKAAIEGSGRSADSAIEDYKSFAKQMADTTTATKGEIISLIQQAETMGVSGKKAKDMATIAVGLAGALGGEATEHFGLARAIETGNVHFVRRMLHLQNIKKDSDVMTAAMKIVTGGLKAQAEILDLPTARWKKLQQTMKEFQKDLGGIVAEVLQPTADVLAKITKWVSSFDASTKKWIVSGMLMAGALFLIGPAIAALAPLFAPLAALLPVIGSAIAFLASPIGLVVAGVAAAAAAFVNWKSVVSATVGWVKAKWDDLTEHFGPSLKGIKDALKAGEISLAFKVLTATLSLEWTRFTGWVKETFVEAWYDLKFIVENLWSDLTNTMTKKTVDAAAAMKESFGEKSTVSTAAFLGGLISPQVAQQAALTAQALNQALDQEGKDAIKKRLDDIKNAGDAARGAEFEKEREQRKVAREKELADAKSALAAAIKAAKEAAEKTKDIKPPEIPTPDTSGVKAATKDLEKLEGAIYGSAEAATRIAQYQQAFQDAFKGTTGEENKGKPLDVSATAAGSAEARTKSDQQVNLLRDIRDTLKDNKAQAIIASPADFY